ncbi:hypothetical protein TR51_25535 [Kitasatospora griseola]|uniref:Uncharacterized protein n=1 Tax=Kitasatospora griseola TaxID=2064 RepID=A0A0D0NTB5_KITGR|nr:hypothetical protein [Kitasatospora griseola]KIQ62406.1 hypothetical protein TR51_25535 [Kitasatospora griseola]
MTRPGTTSPDLVGELRAMQERIAALERKPVPQTLFDQYPSIEWSAIGRSAILGNTWTSCGVANVTGLKYDRLEVKYLTDRIITGRSEAEIRLAAFRHDKDAQYKECISASNVVRLSGDSVRTIGVGKWRWIHGIRFGWDYSDSDNGIYTVELQHRNPDNCPQRAEVSAVQQIYGFSKLSSDPDPYHQDIISDSAGRYWAAALGPSNNTLPYAGWLDLRDRYSAWDGSYSVSNMHYCVGLSPDRIPEASTSGWHWYTGGGSAFVRAADINEPYLNF